MNINVIGAGIGAQHIGGDPEHYEWRVSYQHDGEGQHFHNVSSLQARSLEDAIQLAKRELGQGISVGNDSAS